ncbi:type II toxin-antitoxin system Phd/YefM family antitoxin [uncultured Sphingomonas sp.]|uniref:type II toxin-antitoxin system Phd/YefM family antitoxin n=1 Tax=uncultured Sphingomonas sp. TaxID=158754 RepID=UPI0035CC5686
MIAPAPPRLHGAPHAQEPATRYSKQIKPVSFVEENAGHLAGILAESDEPLILTEGGEARIVVQSVKAYEETQETIAFLKILLMGMEDVQAGRTIPADEAFESVLRGLADR